MKRSREGRGGGNDVKERKRLARSRIEHDLIFFCFVILGRFAMVRA